MFDEFLFFVVVVCFYFFAETHILMKPRLVLNSSYMDYLWSRSDTLSGVGYLREKKSMYTMLLCLLTLFC